MGVFARVTGTSKDADGPPVARGFRRAAVLDREVDELIGICKGVLADGDVSFAEGKWVLEWLNIHRELLGTWPASAIYPRLESALRDGALSVDEERDLLEPLQHAIGINSNAIDEGSGATKLPYTDPLPAIEFAGRAFCFTGKCCSGTRDLCELQVIQRGGQIGPVSKNLNYLVIGEIGSRDWLHSTFGLKIQKAVHYSQSGVPLAIVGEEHWHLQLG